MGHGANKDQDTHLPSRVSTQVEAVGDNEGVSGEKAHTSWWQYELVPAKTPPTMTMVVEEPRSSTSGAPSVLHTSVPNILNPRGNFREIVSVGALETREDRLALLGGLPGIIAHIRRDGVTPNIQTFTMLLDLLPGLVTAETDLLAVMNTFNVQPDTSFFNQLIRKRNQRDDYEGAKVSFYLCHKLSIYSP